MPDGLRRATADDLAAIVALQRAAYERNREILGVEPLPLKADYAEVIAQYEIWLAEGRDGLQAVLILHPRDGDLLIWSVATAPAAQGRGFGNRLLVAAETRARELARDTLRLYTGEKLIGNIAWYQRHGFAIEAIEPRSDRNVVRMVKRLD